MKEKLEHLMKSYQAAGWFATFHDNTYFFAAPSGYWMKVYNSQGRCDIFEVGRKESRQKLSFVPAQNEANSACNSR